LIYTGKLQLQVGFSNPKNCFQVNNNMIPTNFQLHVVVLFSPPLVFLYRYFAHYLA
jgi:hypothetical protein